MISRELLRYELSRKTSTRREFQLSYESVRSLLKTILSPLDYSHICSVIEAKGAIHSTKISGNFGLKLNGSVRSNRKSFEKISPPFEVDHFSRLDRSDRNGPFHLTIPAHSQSHSQSCCSVSSMYKMEENACHCTFMDC